jgi:hypothetical protein
MVGVFATTIVATPADSVAVTASVVLSFTGNTAFVFVGTVTVSLVTQDVILRTLTILCPSTLEAGVLKDAIICLLY